jgi:hypothetical protein
MKSKGIYCIEGLWNHRNITDKSSVLPILDLLSNRGICDYVYHDCATIQELEFLLSKWNTKSVSNKYPILYLAFHGETGCIIISNNVKYTLEDLASCMENKCNSKVIFFGSCSTLKVDIRKINSFLDKTGAIATIGYKTDIDWIQSTACDLFAFEALQNDKLDSKGIQNIYKQIVSDYGNLHKLLELRIVINQNQHFPRKRK